MKKMKKQLLFVVSIVLTATFYAQNIPSYVPTNGLVGWWPFNGNANDESGNGNHGTLLGGTSNSLDRNNNSNSAITIDGINCNTITKGISLPNKIDNTKPYSISIWYKTNDSLKLNQTLFNSNPHTYIAVNFNYCNKISLSSWLGNNNGWLKQGCSDNNFWTIDNKTIWHNITLVKKVDMVEYYFDGTLLGKTNITSNYNSGNFNLIFGAINHNGEVACFEALNGNIDDIAIYNRTLTQEEITALFVGGACSKPSASITPKSTTNIKENEAVVLAATKGNGYTYTWYKDGVAIANATDSNYTANLPGVYTVKVTSAACDSTSAAVTVKRVYALPNYLPSNGLVGWWPFNGNANDESGNENHGTVNGATLTSDKNGEVNKAYSFDGVDDIIQFKTSNLPYLKSDRTISIWFLKQNNSSNWTHTALSYGSPSKANAVMIGVGNNNKLAVQGWIDDFPLSQNCSNNWENITFSLSNGLGKVYYNGLLISTQDLQSWNTIESVFYLGSRCDLANSYFFGKIDDIAIYNRALTQEEITVLYLGEACTTPIATITPQSATSFCSGGSVNINAATNANYTYQWLNNGAPISSATTASYKATTSGKYSVIVKNNSGCIDTSSVVTVTVTPTPSLPILTGPATLCYNSKAIFKASIAGGTWGVANDYLLISSPQGLFRNNKMPPSNLYKTGVTYTLKSKDKLCSVTAQKSVWIRNVAATSVTLTASKQTLKVGEEVAATATTKISGNALFWMSASTSFVSVTGVSPYIALIKGLRPATGANITFSVDDAAKGCRNAAFLPFTVTAAASLVDNESNTITYTTDLNVYPNPSNGMVTIENIGDAKTISLIDVTGRVLKTTAVNADRMRLDYSTITKGNYFISIQGETIKEMKSIVIE